MTRQEQDARYAELMAELGGLVVAMHGENAADDDTLSIVLDDVSQAIDDAYPS